MGGKCKRNKEILSEFSVNLARRAKRLAKSSVSAQNSMEVKES